MKELARDERIQKKRIQISAIIMLLVLFSVVALPRNPTIAMMWVLALVAAIVNVFYQAHEMDKLAKLDPDLQKEMSVSVNKAMGEMMKKFWKEISFMIIIVLIAWILHSG